MRLTLNSDFRTTLRRLKPEKSRAQLKQRDESDLDFIETTGKKPGKLLYDTTVYVDILQNRFPQAGEFMLRAAEAWHCRSPKLSYLRQLDYLIRVIQEQARLSSRLRQ